MSDDYENEYQPVYFPFYLDRYDDYQDLSNEQAGRLDKALITLAKTGEIPDFSDDQTIRRMFAIYRRQMFRDFEKMEKKSENGKKGGAPVGNQNAAKRKDLSKEIINNPDVDFLHKS